MFKTGELLKRKIRRYVVPTVAMVVLAAITLVVCAAVSGKVVYIYDGEVVTNLKTGQPTVGEALAEAEIIPGEFDFVEPSTDTKIKTTEKYVNLVGCSFKNAIPYTMGIIVPNEDKSLVRPKEPDLSAAYIV